MFFRNFNYQVFISYFGVFPFIFIFLDIFYFNIFKINLIKDFVIYYTLIIFVFIGAMRWNFNNNFNLQLILFGFIPSLLASIIILINILEFEKSLIIIIISILLFIQSFLDFLYSKKKYQEKKFILKVRIPLTAFLIINLFYLIFV